LEAQASVVVLDPLEKLAAPVLLAPMAALAHVVHLASLAVQVWLARLVRWDLLVSLVSEASMVCLVSPDGLEVVE